MACCLLHLLNKRLVSFLHMTVGTLEFCVNLLLGWTIPKLELLEIVQDWINELNLQKAADTIIDEIKVQGICGGDQK